MLCPTQLENRALPERQLHTIKLSVSLQHILFHPAKKGCVDKNETWVWKGQIWSLAGPAYCLKKTQAVHFMWKYDCVYPLKTIIWECAESSLWTDSCLFLEPPNCFPHEWTREEGVRRREDTYLFPLNSVCSRGLGLTLPLDIVSKHDDLRLDRGDAHRVNVCQTHTQKQLRERKEDTWEHGFLYILKCHVWSANQFSSLKCPCRKVVRKRARSRTSAEV